MIQDTFSKSIFKVASVKVSIETVEHLTLKYEVTSWILSCSSLKFRLLPLKEFSPMLERQEEEKKESKNMAVMYMVRRFKIEVKKYFMVICWSDDADGSNGMRLETAWRNEWNELEQLQVIHIFDIVSIMQWMKAHIICDASFRCTSKSSIEGSSWLLSLTFWLLLRSLSLSLSLSFSLSWHLWRIWIFTVGRTGRIRLNKWLISIGPRSEH